MTDREKLVKAVTECRIKTGKSLSWLSHELFDDGKTLQRILAGGGCKVATLEAALEELPRITREFRAV